MVDLRTRLAKTLHRLYGPSLGAHPWGWDCEPKGTQGMFLDDADAVIRELRLHVVMVGDFETVIKGSYPKPLED